MRAGEQSARRSHRRRVLGAQTQDARDQSAERIAMLHGDETDDRRVPLRRLAPEHGESAADGARIQRRAFLGYAARRFSFLARCHWSISRADLSRTAYLVVSPAHG